MAERLTYEDSFRKLQADGWEGPGPIPPSPSRPPRYDDEILCLSFFRTLVENATMEDLTIPRVYFGKSMICKTSFARTDLTESVANWNDFEDVDFTEANLTRFDFRGCSLVRINFESVRLVEADLRCCSFEACSFEGADMTSAKITRKAGAELKFSTDQLQQINWQDDDGDDPDGG